MFPARCAVALTWPTWMNDGDAGQLFVLAQEVHPQWEKWHNKNQNGKNWEKFAIYDKYYLNSTSDESCIEARFTRISIDSVTRRIAFDPQPGNTSFSKCREGNSGRQQFDIIVARDRRIEWPEQFLESSKIWNKSYC